MTVRGTNPFKNRRFDPNEWGLIGVFLFSLISCHKFNSEIVHVMLLKAL